MQHPFTKHWQYLCVLKTCFLFFTIPVLFLPFQSGFYPSKWYKYVCPSKRTMSIKNGGWTFRMLNFWVQNFFLVQKIVRGFHWSGVVFQGWKLWENVGLQGCLGVEWEAGSRRRMQPRAPPANCLWETSLASLNWRKGRVHERCSL